MHHAPATCVAVPGKSAPSPVAPAVVALAKKHNVEMPICAAVDAVLAGRMSVDDAITALLTRPFGPETY